MPNKIYYHDEGTLTATVNGTNIDVAEVRGVTMTPQAEHNRFYGPDSIQYQEVKRSQFQVGVDIEYAQFDEDFVQWWLDGTAGPTGTAGASKSTQINDTNNVAQFNITADQPMGSGDFKLTNIATDVDFPEIPAIDTTEGEYASHSVSGTAKGIVHRNEST